MAADEDVTMRLGHSKPMKRLRKSLRKIVGDQRRFEEPAPSPDGDSIGIGFAIPISALDTETRALLETEERVPAPPIRMEPDPWENDGTGAHSAIRGSPEWPVYRVMFNQIPTDGPDAYPYWEEDDEAFVFDVHGVDLPAAHKWAVDNVHDGEFFCILAVIHDFGVDFDWLYDFSVMPEVPQNYDEYPRGTVTIRVAGPWPAAGVWHDSRAAAAESLPTRPADRSY